MYKSNIVEVNNKNYKKKCRSKFIYYDEDCLNRYKIKIIKIRKEEQIKYKIYVTVYCKVNNRKYKAKFNM